MDKKTATNLANLIRAAIDGKNRLIRVFSAKGRIGIRFPFVCKGAAMRQRGWAVSRPEWHGEPKSVEECEAKDAAYEAMFEKCRAIAADICAKYGATMEYTELPDDGKCIRHEARLIKVWF